MCFKPKIRKFSTKFEFLNDCYIIFLQIVLVIISKVQFRTLTLSFYSINIISFNTRFAYKLISFTTAFIYLYYLQALPTSQVPHLL